MYIYKDTERCRIKMLMDKILLCKVVVVSLKVVENKNTLVYKLNNIIWWLFDYQRILKRRELNLKEKTFINFSCLQKKKKNKTKKKKKK